jgi:hypothetical protein
MSLHALLPRVDVVVVGSDLIEEQLWAAIYPDTTLLSLRGVKTLPTELKGHGIDRVCVCGSYFTPESVRAFQGLLRPRTRVLVYSTDDMRRYEAAGVRNVELYALPAAVVRRHPWTVHLVRRTRGAVAGEIPQDEDFYRGAILQTVESQRCSRGCASSSLFATPIRASSTCNGARSSTPVAWSSVYKPTRRVSWFALPVVGAACSVATRRAS